MNWNCRERVRRGIEERERESFRKTEKREACKNVGSETHRGGFLWETL